MRRMAALLTAMALGGCASFAPPYRQPALPVAETYPPELLPAGSGEIAAADIEWQRFFTDERLKRLIGLAIDNNRDLRVAVLNIEQTRALYQIRRADEFPTIGVGGTATRAPAGTGTVVTSYAVGVALSGWELDFFGRLRSLSDVALAQFFATEEARKTVQISIVAGVAASYIGLIADEELLSVTRQALASREDSYRLTKLRFDAGVVSELDFRQAESLLEAARVQLAQAQRQRLLDENALVQLIGQPLPADLPPALTLEAQTLRADLPAGLPSELLIRRPDVRSAEQQLRGAYANIGAARAAFFPRISLTATAGTASLELSGLFKSGSFAITGTAQLLQPIFDAGRNRANLDLANVNRDIAVAQYERTVQTAFREVADSLAGRATLGEQLRAQTAQAAALETVYRLADLRYRNGASSFLEVLDAQRQLFTAQLAVVQTRAAQAQNLVTLYKVLGGGWSEPATVVGAR